MLWATDFFTCEVWTKGGLTTFYVLFFIHLKTRRVVIGGVSENPGGSWVTQITRNVTGCDEPMNEARYLIHDRDSKYTRNFRNLLWRIIMLSATIRESATRSRFLMSDL